MLIEVNAPMSNMNRIFGYEWEDIQRVQRGGRLQTQLVDTSKPPTSAPTDEDRRLLAQHGTLEALEAIGLYGVADRLRHE